jgi:hypothetical protein
MDGCVVCSGVWEVLRRITIPWSDRWLGISYSELIVDRMCGHSSG